MKFTEAKVTFAEVPNEISLCINISGCPVHCPDCHSKYLWEDVGTELTFEVLDDLIKQNRGITCICFCGGDGFRVELFYFLVHIRKTYPNLKTAWYSGRDTCSGTVLAFLDYIKLGPYIKERGALNEPDTNQVFYRVDHTEALPHLKDVTYLFRNRDVD